MRAAINWPGVARSAAILCGYAVFTTKCVTDNETFTDDLLDGLTGTTLIIAGYVDLRRRGSLGVGNILIAAGVLWFFEDLVTIHHTLLRTISLFLPEAPTPVLSWLILSFPATRLRGRLNWFLVGSTAVVSWIVSPMYEFAYAGDRYDHLALHWNASRQTIDLVHAIQTGMEAPLALGVAVLLGVRLTRVTAARRRIVRPIYLASILATVFSAVEAVAVTPTSGRAVPGVAYVIRELSDLSILLVPAGFLISSLTLELGRARLAALMRLDSGTASTASLEDALQLAVGDHLLALRAGPDASATVGAGRVAVPLFDGDTEVGTLDVDRVLTEAGGILDTLEDVCVASLRQRSLNQALQEQYAEVVSSRARLVQAADDARRRVERDLHDGAQQTLVAASMALRRAIRTPGDRDRLLADVDRKLRLSLQELRDLSRGVAPPLLAEQGLGPALRSLRDRCPIAVGLHGLPEQRLAEEVERAAYFVVAESLTNAAKHADASLVDVTVICAGDSLEVHVADDGVGGARLGEGGGLRGLQDRVAAARGKLEVDSPRGEGTRIRVSLPLG